MRDGLNNRMKRSPLPPRSKPLARTGIKRPRVASVRFRGAIVSCVLTQSTGNEPRTLKTAPAKKIKKVFRAGGIPQNPKYLAFVRLNTCILFGLTVASGKLRGKYTHACSGMLEAAHTGPRGNRQKAADETALPMCSNGHRTGIHAHHKGTRTFWGTWGLNREALVKKFNSLAREAGIQLAEGFRL